jgi:hypothetical protein
MLIQDTVIPVSENTPITRPEDMRCFGKFSQIEWKDNKVTLKATSEAAALKTSSASPPSETSQGMESRGEQKRDTSKNIPLDQMVIHFKNQTIEDRLAAFGRNEIDFVGPISESKINPKSLLENVRKMPREDLFVFLAPIDGSGRSKIGEFIAKALNRGELFGLNYSGASLLENSHLVPKSFTLAGDKPLVASLPDFNFASVADSKAFIAERKPPLTSLKITHEGSDLTNKFISFFKARLQVSYKIDLLERLLDEQKESLGYFQKEDLILTRLRYSDHYLKDLLGLLTKYYPIYKNEFKKFEQALDKKDKSSEDLIKLVQDLEKFVLPKYLVIPLGDVSYNYFLSVDIHGETFDRNLDIPLFFNSFLTY